MRVQPRVLRRAFQGKDKAAIQATNRSILAVLRALVSSVQGTHPVLDVVSSVFETRDRSDADSLGLLKCCEIVAQLLHERVTSEPVRPALSAPCSLLALLSLQPALSALSAPYYLCAQHCGALCTSTATLRA